MEREAERRRVPGAGLQPEAVPRNEGTKSDYNLDESPQYSLRDRIV